jgi:hypothetical protein
MSGLTFPAWPGLWSEAERGVLSPGLRTHPSRLWPLSAKRPYDVIICSLVAICRNHGTPGVAAPKF